MKREILEQLQRDREVGRQVGLVTDIDTGVQTLLYPFDPPDQTRPGDQPGERGFEPHFKAGLVDHVRAALDMDRSGLVEVEGRRLFVHVFNPPLRVVIVGAVHIAQILTKTARLAGFDVTVVDPRRAFASDRRFGDLPLLRQWPEAALAALGVNRRTALVTLSHDPKLDDPALSAGLRSDAFYIGALGSRKTQAKRVVRLTEAGFTPEEIARIHGPVGLNIGARTAAEIAVSILAEIIQTLRASKRAPGEGV